MADNRNRTGTQSAIGYGATEAAARRNSPYEFSTELGGNTPAAAGTGNGQANRVGTQNQRTSVNLRGEYSGKNAR